MFWAGFVVVVLTLLLLLLLLTMARFLNCALSARWVGQLQAIVHCDVDESKYQSSQGTSLGTKFKILKESILGNQTPQGREWKLTTMLTVIIT